MFGSGCLRVGRVALGIMLGGALLPAAAPMAALAHSPTVYTIGVDNAGPTGHNFEYVDYFPREGVKVAAGDVLDFNWNNASLDGAHTATFLTKGESLPQLALPTPNGDEPGLQLNPAILFPTNPTCGETSSNPCVFDGSQAVNSGFIFNANPTPPYFSDFYVKLDPKLVQGRGSVDVPYVCEIHPGMRGSVTVVSDAADATPVGQLEANSARQLEDDTTGALKAENDANTSLVQNNGDGTSRITITAGTATPFVEVAEMLPNTLTIKPGDSVIWVTKTIKDPHTVTFPSGEGSVSVDPLPAFCEATPKDTLPSDSGPPCANPAAFEVRLVPQPQGSSVIQSQNTIGTSGVIGSTADGFSERTEFSFTNAGSFAYMCRIHDHMVGLIVAKS